MKINSMFTITKLEPQDKIGFSKNIYIIAATMTSLEGLTLLFIFPWSSITNPGIVLLKVCIFIFIQLTLIAWFAKLIEKGSRRAVFIQTLICPIAMLVKLNDIAKAIQNMDPYVPPPNKWFPPPPTVPIELAWHSFLFSTISFVMIPSIIIANWILISKIKKGILCVNE